MRINGYLASLIGGAAFLFNISNAAAVLTIFDDRAAFLAAIGGSAEVSEDFSSFSANDPFRNLTLDIGLFSLRADGPNHDDHNLVNLSGTDLFNVDETTFAKFFVIPDTQLQDGTTATISFDRPVVAFGADFSTLENAVFSVNGQTISHPSSPDDQFFGFTVDVTEAFSQISIGGSEDRFGMDNVLFTTIGEVPEPGMLALLGLGLLGLGVARRRTKTTRR
jgi:hypothetical protein